MQIEVEIERILKLKSFGGNKAVRRSSGNTFSLKSTNEVTRNHLQRVLKRLSNREYHFVSGFFRNSCVTKITDIWENIKFNLIPSDSVETCSAHLTSLGSLIRPNCCWNAPFSALSSTKLDDD